jgi:methylmalonyl-CoA/ethylmalonyl-CoA epimerase
MELQVEDLIRTDGRILQQKLTLHHIGVLVKSIDEAAVAYRGLNARISEPVFIASQSVRVCFVDMNCSVAIELVEPTEKGVSQDLLKRGITYYHLGYLARNFDVALENLAELSYVHLQTFQSEAFEGRRCAFLMSPVLHLIEVIERGIKAHGRHSIAP